MTEQTTALSRYYADKEDWPLWCGRQWYAVYDRATGEMLRLRTEKVMPWRYGSLRSAQKTADRLNRLVDEGYLDRITEATG